MLRGLWQKKQAAAHEELRNVTCKNVHSKIYHKVRVDVFSKTGNASKAKKAASEACARAKEKVRGRNSTSISVSHILIVSCVQARRPLILNMCTALF